MQLGGTQIGDPWPARDSYQDEQVKSRNLSKNNSFYKIGQHLIENYFHKELMNYELGRIWKEDVVA